MNAQERSQLENWLNHLHGLLGRFDALWGQRATLEQQLQPEQQHRQKWKVWVIAVFSLAFIFLGFTVFSSITGIITSIVLLPFSGVEYGDPLEGLVRFLMWTVPVVLSIGLAIAVVLFRNRVLLPRANTKIDVVNQQRRAGNDVLAGQIHAVDSRIAEANGEFQGHMSELHRLTGDGFPERYLYQDAVAFCWHMVHDHRADSIGKALNLYVEQLKHNEQLQKQQELIEETQRVRKQVMVGSVVNAAVTGAGIGAANANAKAARQQSAANTQRIIDNANKPKTVWVKRG